MPFSRKRGKGLQTKPPPAFGGHPLSKGGFLFSRTPHLRVKKRFF